MNKKAALAGFAFVLGMNFAAPQAQAQVRVGVGVQVGAPVVVAPAPVVVAPAPVVVRPAPVVVAVAPPPTVVVYDDAFFAVHYWDSGYHDGWYYDNGTRYWVDKHHRRHYDHRYRDHRISWERRHRHDNGRHRGWYKDHDRGRDRHDRHADRRHDRYDDRHDRHEGRHGRD